MRITSAGDVGIGNTAPGAKLEVTGAIRSLRTGSTAALLQVINDNNSWNITSGTTTAQFRIDNNLLGTALTINGNSNIVLAGGTATASGVGITFPATQSASSDANCLDDYEEGTWTPTIASQTGSITSYTSAGQYTKIGRNVFLTFTTTLTNVGTAGGRLQFSNLPFAALNLANGRPAVLVGRENAVTGIPVLGWLDGNSTTGEIASLSFTAITWTNGYQYTMSVTYQSTQ